jgi:hypothetical protein
MSGLLYQDRLFTEPVDFGGELPARAQGLYAILVADYSWWPRPYRVLYFGESDNLAKSVNSKHEKYNEWLREASGAPLLVAIHTTPRQKAQKRKDAASELISALQPPCNQQLVEA